MDAEILSWFTRNGGTYDTDCLGLSQFPGHGRGGIALKDIPKDHTLFSIPRDLTLSLRTCTLPALFGNNAWKAAGLSTGWAGLMLCMMWEESRGPDSRWSVYLESMPTAFSTPMFWNEQEIKELEGTAVVDKIGREDAEKDYYERVAPALRSRPDLFPQNLVDVHFTLERYHMMGSRVLSRSFNVEKWDPADDPPEEDPNAMNVDSSPSRAKPEPATQEAKGEVDEEGDTYSDVDEDAHKEDGADGHAHDHSEDGGEGDEDDEDPADVAMIPMADALNARYGSENAKLFYEKQFLRMVSTKPIAAGEQIWNTYGDPPNSDLLRRYGHVDQVPLPEGGLGNPADIVEIPADLVVFTANPTAEQERIDWWLEEGGDDTFILDNDFDVPKSMISLIKLVQLSSAEWEKAKEKGKPPKAKADAGVLEVLIEVLKKRLAQYPTSMEADKELLSTKMDITDNHKNAIIVRLGEKRLLNIVLNEQAEHLKSLQPVSNDAKRKRGADGTAGSTRNAKKGKKWGT